MGQVTIRNLDDGVLERLRTKARLNQRSLEQELREILSRAAPLSGAEKEALIRDSWAQNPQPQTDSTDWIRADRDRDDR